MSHPFRLIESSLRHINWRATVTEHTKEQNYWFLLRSRGEKPIFFIVIHRVAVFVGVFFFVFRVRIVLSVLLLKPDQKCEWVIEREEETNKQRKRKLCQTKWYMEIKYWRLRTKRQNQLSFSTEPKSEMMMVMAEKKKKTKNNHIYGIDQLVAYVFVWHCQS